MLADPADARSRRVRLTDLGRARQKEARLLWERMQARFEETFGPSQTAALREALLQLATLKLHIP
jgi:DNA-binding MarR family transcriptional regulator